MSPGNKPPRKGPQRGRARSGSGFTGGGQPNVQALMRQAQRMQEQMEQAQVELAAQQVTGSAGGGMVTATMTGAGELVSLAIDPRAVDADDVETLQDLVVAAVRDAARVATELSEQTLGPISGDTGLPGL